ncbi:hypothetical protein ACWG8W_06270 [Citricoccus zhacaiensis]
MTRNEKLEELVQLAKDTDGMEGVRNLCHDADEAVRIAAQVVWSIQYPEETLFTEEYDPGAGWDLYEFCLQDEHGACVFEHPWMDEARDERKAAVNRLAVEDGEADPFDPPF